MDLKKIKIIAVFGIFSICFLAHFIYTWFPNTLFSIFFPVNESIWEHMKMFSTSILIYSVVDFILLKKNEIFYHNFLISLLFQIFFGIIFFLIVYLPIYAFTGENLPLNFIVLFISICFSQIVSYYVLMAKNYDLLNYISLIGIIFIYIIFGILTYYPPINDLFYDKMHEKYGINTYNAWYFNK